MIGGFKRGLRPVIRRAFRPFDGEGGETQPVAVDPGPVEQRFSRAGEGDGSAGGAVNGEGNVLLQPLKP
ncbi:hypothetical protein [Agrobacterium sp. B1(2019)]|uniref:hypothetical protein n=1 Tax=Agrobacterium sp. B1(2019) TaxID=2607032 RepID=UPI001659B591|nr:hypothetical protein [Agrobacterium sp. B1(2019)]